MQRYTSFELPKARGRINEIDDLLEDIDSDSVSVSSSGSSESVSSIDLNANDLGCDPSLAEPKPKQSLKKEKSKKKISSQVKKPDPVEDRWFSGPIRQVNPTFSGVMSENYAAGK